MVTLHESQLHLQHIKRHTHFLGDCPFCFKQILFIIALYLLNENVTTEINLSRMKINFKICTHLVTFIRYLILNCISFGNVLRDNTKIYHISPEILFNLFYYYLGRTQTSPTSACIFLRDQINLKLLKVNFHHIFLT